MTISFEHPFEATARPSAPSGLPMPADDGNSIGEAAGVSATVAQQIDTEDAASNAFTTAYLIVVNSLTDTLYREIARARAEVIDRSDENRRTEVCAAVWATIQAGLAASLLTSRQQQFVRQALSDRLYSHWQEHLCSRDDLAGKIGSRVVHYQQQIEPQDPVSSAVRIVECLLDATGVPLEKRGAQVRLLGGLVSHRIVSDVWLFNDWESQGKLRSAS